MILVTGGAGYIGSVLVQELLKKGEAVRVFDKLYFGDGGLKASRDKVEIIQGDIRKMEPGVLDGVDAVIHLAGLSNDPTAEFNPKANMEINCAGTENLARLCMERGVKRFAFASTCSVYDKGLLAEDVLQDETSEVHPRAAYAISKREAEDALLAMAGPELCPVILRQGTVYGFSPRMRYDLVVNSFLKDAFQKGRLTVFCGGEMWRPLVDVNDCARAFICCVEADERLVNGQIFNLSHKNYRVLELAHWVREALRPIKKVEIEVDYSEAKARSYRVSTKKLENVLGLKPGISVKESVELMVRHIQRDGINDFNDPIYYNIRWMQLLDEMERTLSRIGSVF